MAHLLLLPIQSTIATSSVALRQILGKFRDGAISLNLLLVAAMLAVKSTTSSQLWAKPTPFCRRVLDGQASGTHTGKVPSKAPVAWQLICAEFGTMPGLQRTVHAAPVVMPPQSLRKSSGMLLSQVLGTQLGSVPWMTPLAEHWYWEAEPTRVKPAAHVTAHVSWKNLFRHPWLK